MRSGLVLIPICLSLLLAVSGCGWISASNRATPKVANYVTQNVPAKDVHLLDRRGQEIAQSAELAFEKAVRLLINKEDIGYTPAYEREILARQLGSTDAASVTPTIVVPIDGQPTQIFWWAAARLSTGDILITGGTKKTQVPHDQINSEALDRSWFYNAKSGAVAEGPRMKHPRMGHCAATLHTGGILITGGHSGRPEQPLATCELLTSTSNQFVSSVELRKPRFAHCCVQLNSGPVLIISGLTTQSESDAGLRATSSVEVLDLAQHNSQIVGQIREARQFGQVLAYKDSQAVIFGGFSAKLTSSEDSEIGELSTVELFSNNTESRKNHQPF